MTIFTETTVETPDEKTPEQIYAELVGEGKKFKTPEELAKGKYEADRFIPQLQRELAEVREELNKRLTVEELMTKITEARSRDEPPPPPPNNQPPVTESPKPEDVSSLISKELEKRERERAETENRKSVRESLIAAFGGTYIEELRKRAASLGLSETEADALAASKPKAFLKALGVEGSTKDTVFNPRPAVNTTSTSAAPGERTWAYYEKLRKEDPKLYYSAKVQLDMFEQAKKLEDKFYNP